MAITKHAYLRYKVIDRCLQHRTKKFGSKDLLKEVNDVLSYENPNSDGVKIRIIQKDLKFMESENGFSAPIQKLRQSRNLYYTYEDKEYSILKHPIKNQDYKILSDAVEVLNNFSGLPQLSLLQEIVPYIQDKLLIKPEAKRDVISFEENIDYSGYDFISILYTHIIEKQVLKIYYQPFMSDLKIDFEFHPHYLKQFNNRWFCFGFNASKGRAAWNVPLDRILSIEILNDTYINCDIDWEEYFFDIVGVTKLENRDVEDVKLSFKKGRGNYVKTKPLHPTQRVNIDDSGQFIVKLELIPNKELLSLIYSFGKDVEVLEPENLLDRDYLK